MTIYWFVFLCFTNVKHFSPMAFKCLTQVNLWDYRAFFKQLLKDLWNMLRNHVTLNNNLSSKKTRNGE